MNLQRRLSLAVAVLVTAFSLVGGSCSKQDPLAGQAENIRNGVPPTQKGDDRNPPASEEMLRIRAADYISFHEGAEGKTTITGAFLQAVNGHEPVLGQDYEVVVTNLADFKNAKYDMQTGEFVWTPEKGYTEQNYTKQAHIDVTVATLAPPILGKSIQIPVWVTRGALVPEVVNISLDETRTYREGDSAVPFTITVRDASALNQDNMRPRIEILSANSTKTSYNALANAVRYQYEVPTVDQKDPNLYVFKMVLDLRDQELTKTKDTLGFSVRAINRYGESSSSVAKSVVVATSLRPPITTLGDAIDVVRGEENTINFSVYDPFNESFITVDFNRCDRMGMGGGTNCVCVTSRTQGATSTMNCTINWKPLATQKLGTVDKEISITSTTKIPNDTLAPFQTKAIVRMNVLPSATESQPTPAPTATPVGAQ